MGTRNLVVPAEIRSELQWMLFGRNELQMCFRVLRDVTVLAKTSGTARCPLAKPVHRPSDGSHDHIDNNPARAAVRVTRAACAMRSSSMGSAVVTLR
jgi:hypothetical protein